MKRGEKMNFKTWDAILRGDIKPERTKEKQKNKIDNVLSKKNISKNTLLNNPPDNMSKVEWRSVCKSIGLLGGYTRREGEIKSVR